MTPKAKDVPTQDTEGMWHTAASKMAPPRLLRRGHPWGHVPSIFTVLSEVKSYKVNSEALKGSRGEVKGTDAKGQYS